MCINFCNNKIILDESDDDDDYLLELPAKKPRIMKMGENEPAETAEELQERTDVIKRKLEQRRATKKSNKNPLTKADRKRIREENQKTRQRMQSLKKVMNNEMMKHDKISKQRKIKEDPDKPNKSTSKVYNKEGKLFFSKVQIEGEENKKKGRNTDPKANLQKLKLQKKKIKDLVESGEKEKAKDEKQKMLWQTAFDKIEGKKVKDNEEILKKTIKKRKVLKKKSKEKWNERKQKLEEKQSTKQKKREENIQKRKTDNQKTKLKKAVNKGRVF